MTMLKTALSGGLLVSGLLSGSAMAAKQAYQVSFQGEAPITVAIEEDSSEKLRVESLKFSSKEAGPRGYVELSQAAGRLVVRLYWWQGNFEELSDTNGSHLTLPVGICDRTMSDNAENPVSVPCWTDTEPSRRFFAVVVEPLKSPT